MNNVESIAKQSFSHLLKNNPQLKVSDLEAEVINLISYLSLRQTKDISWRLSFLDESNIQEIINSDEDAMKGVTDTAMKMFPDSYNEGNAFVAMQGVIMNLKMMSASDYSKFLKEYFSSKHRVEIL